ncbi:hypothetical protein QUA27_26340 [Microcoleus sp. Pol14C6]|jgi:hypothetical protein|uniref:hypothetical protein n=1 Tax=Microcoleus sp. Pol14C6 TaxID=3055399 RepID=UPI002FD3109E
MSDQRDVALYKKERMTDVHILAMDLAKGSSQVCGTGLGEAALLNRMVSRGTLETIFREQAPFEACAISYFWGGLRKVSVTRFARHPPLTLSLSSGGEERCGRRSSDWWSLAAISLSLCGSEERRASGPWGGVQNSPNPSLDNERNSSTDLAAIWQNLDLSSGKRRPESKPLEG